MEPQNNLSVTPVETSTLAQNVPSVGQSQQTPEQTQGQPPEGYVSQEDFKALQSSLTSQNDKLRNQLRGYENQISQLQVTNTVLPDQLNQVRELAMQAVPEEQRSQLELIQLRGELEQQRILNQQIAERMQREEMLGQLSQQTGADFSELEPTASYWDATNHALSHMTSRMSELQSELETLRSQQNANAASTQESSVSQVVGQTGVTPTVQNELQTKYTQAMLSGDMVTADRVQTEAAMKNVTIDNMAWVREKFGHKGNTT